MSKYTRLIQHINKIHLTPFKPTNPKHNCRLQSEHMYIIELASLVMPNKDTKVSKDTKVLKNPKRLNISGAVQITADF